MGEFTDTVFFKQKIGEDSNCTKEIPLLNIPESAQLFNEFDNFFSHESKRYINSHDDGVLKAGFSTDDVVHPKDITNLQESCINTNSQQESEENMIISLPVNDDKNYQNISVFEELSLLDKELNSLLYIDKDENTISQYHNYQQFNEGSLLQPIRNQLSQSEHETYGQTQQFLQTCETEFEDSVYIPPETRSNTESFSELRFSVSETHSEFNFSDSDSRTSPEIERPTTNKNFNLIDQFPNIFNYSHNIPIDDTTGILYEMSKQINKVPELLSGLKRPISVASTSDSDITNNSGGTLEEGVFSCFSHCDNLSVMGQSNSRGQDELGQLEAAVDRMMNQVEIQENLLKEDLNFVPLVLEKKEVKAFPLLVNTLCLSPPVHRKQFSLSSIRGKEKKMPFSKKGYCVSEPELLQHDVFENINNDSSANYSISKLEKSVNRLLNEVEKEEEKLGLSSLDSETIYTSPLSTTDISSEDDSFGVWWEGAYRSLPRHPARKRLAKNSTYYKNKLKYKTLNSPHLKSVTLGNGNSKNVKLNDNKTSQSKLLVKTTESGKSALEIRTCNDITESHSVEGDFKFCKMFKKTQSQAFSSWNRSLPSLQDNRPDLSKSLFGSVGSDDSINYIKYIQPSDCIQYFTPCPSMTLDSTGYCTWTDRFSGEHSSVSVRTTSQERPEDSSSPKNDSQKFTETINIETHEHLADKIREKESKYQFTMTVLNKEGFTEMSNTLAVFLENEKDYNKLFFQPKHTEFTAEGDTEVPSSDETEESQSKSESEPKSDKSFVGKMSQKLFGVFKKDEKGKSKKKKEKIKKHKKEPNKNEEVCYNISGADIPDELVKKTISETLDSTTDSINSKAKSYEVKSNVTDSIQTSEQHTKDEKCFKSTSLADDSKGKTEYSITEPSADSTPLVLPNQDPKSIKEIGKSLLPTNGKTSTIPVEDVNIHCLDEPQMREQGVRETVNVQGHGVTEKNKDHSYFKTNFEDIENRSLENKEDLGKIVTLIQTLPAVESNVTERLETKNLKYKTLEGMINESEKSVMKEMTINKDTDSIKLDVNSKLTEITDEVGNVENKFTTLPGATSNIAFDTKEFGDKSSAMSKGVSDNIKNTLRDKEVETVDIVERKTDILKDKTVSFADEYLDSLGTATKNGKNDFRERSKDENREIELSFNFTNAKSGEAESNKNVSTDKSEGKIVSLLKGNEIIADENMATITVDKIDRKSGHCGIETVTTDEPNSDTSTSESVKAANNKIKSFFGGLFGRSHETKDDVKDEIDSSLPSDCRNDPLQGDGVEQKIMGKSTQLSNDSHHKMSSVQSHPETGLEVSLEPEKKHEEKEKLESGFLFPKLNLSVLKEDIKTQTVFNDEDTINKSTLITEPPTDKSNKLKILGKTNVDSESAKQEGLREYVDVTQLISETNETKDSVFSSHITEPIQITTTTTTQPQDSDESHGKVIDSGKQNILVELKYQDPELVNNLLQSNLGQETTDKCNTITIPSVTLFDKENDILDQIHTEADKKKIEINKKQVSLMSTVASSAECTGSGIKSNKNEVENIIDNYFKPTHKSDGSTNILENIPKDVSDFTTDNKEEIFTKTIDEIVPRIFKAPQNVQQSPDIACKSTKNNDDKLNNMLIDMLIEQECMKIPSEEICKSPKTQTELPTLFEKHDNEVSDRFSETAEFSDLRSVHSFGKIESLMSDSDIKKITERETPSGKPYVTTPTMQRRKIGGSQRLSREERPTLREISHLSDYSSSDEETSNRYTVTEPIDQSSTRKVSFHVESEDETCLKVSDSSSEPEVDVTEMTPSPVPIFKDQDQIPSKESQKVITDQKISTDGSKKYSKKVEQHFERMASETFEADAEVKFTADKEFQRMVSQLSAEEVEACISQWDEGGLTPSEEQDSSNTTTEGELGPDIEALPEAFLASTNPFYSQSSQWVEFDHGINNIPSSIFWAFDTTPPSGVVQPSELDIPIKSKRTKGETTGEEAEGSPSPATTRETDEALLDLAAGLQDNKGSSGGLGPSNSK